MSVTPDYIFYIYKNKLYVFFCWGFAYDVWKIKKKKKTETKNVKTGNCRNISIYFDKRLK